MRARQFGWPYSYGFYEPEGDRTAGAERWMARRATALIDISGPVVQVSVRSPLPGVARDPLRVRAWVEGRLVIDARLSSDAPASATARVPAGLTQAVLDVEVSRTVRPSSLDPSVHDDRELGALVSWRSGVRER